MMLKLSKKDIYSSIVAPTAFIGGALLLVVVYRVLFNILIERTTGILNIHTLNAKSVSFAIGIFIAIFSGAWGGAYFGLKYYMKLTHQTLFKETYRIFALLAIACLFAVALPKSLLEAYVLWFFSLALAYILARLIVNR